PDHARQGAGELPQAHPAEQAAEVLAGEDRVALEEAQHGLAARLELAEELEPFEEIDERAIGVVAGVRAELEPEPLRRRSGVEAAADARLLLDDAHGAAGARGVECEAEAGYASSDDDDVVRGHGRQCDTPGRRS